MITRSNGQLDIKQRTLYWNAAGKAKFAAQSKLYKDRPTKQPNDRMTDRPNNRTNDRPNNRTTDRLNNRTTDRKIGWLIAFFTFSTIILKLKPESEKEWVLASIDESSICRKSIIIPLRLLSSRLLSWRVGKDT